MLSVFPDLFTYGLVAPFILRISIGAFFVLLGIRRLKNDAPAWDILWTDIKIGSLPLGPIFAKVQILIGIFLFIGLYTQVVALLAIVFIWGEAFRKNKRVHLSFQELWMTLLLSAICVSFLFLGAGFLAFDLPL